MLEQANLLTMMGIPLLTIRPGESKAPISRGWPTVELTPEYLDQVQAKYAGFGLAVKLGGVGRLIDIEGDGPGAEANWSILTKGLDVPETVSWCSARGSHRLFVVPDTLRGLTGEGVIKAGDLEIRLGSHDTFTHYSIIPPFGERTWINDLTTGHVIATLPYDLAVRIQALQANKLPEYGDEYENPQPDAPGSIYCDRTDWDDLLLPDGWTKIGQRIDNVQDWCRPGKGAGLSATTGFCGDRLYVFTTSVAGLESGVTYSKYQYLTFTQYDGDFAASARALVKLGYVKALDVDDIFGEDDTPQVTGESDGCPTLDDILGDTTWTSSKPDVVEQGLSEEIDESKLYHIETEKLLFPGFVSDFAHFHAKRAQRYDLRSGAVVGIVFQSWLMGRKVMLEDGTRANLAAMLLGPSSIGKTAAVQSLNMLISDLGFHDSLFRKFKSWQGMEDAILSTPNMIYIQEEAQDLLRAISDERGNGYLTGLATVMKELITASGSMHRIRTGAGTSAEATEHVDQPYLSLLFTGLADEVWGAINDRLMRDGLAGRLWPIELQQRPERNECPVVDNELFARCRAHCKSWLARTPEELDPPMGEDGEITIARLEPAVINLNRACKAAAWDFAKYTDDMQGVYEELNPAAASVWGRGHELFCKFIMLIAGSRDAECKITYDDTIHAKEIVETTFKQKIYRMDTRVGDDTGNTLLRERVLRYLRRREDEGTTECKARDIMRNTNLTKQQLDMVLIELMHRGEAYVDSTFNPAGTYITGRINFICLPQYRENILRAKGTGV